MLRQNERLPDLMRSSSARRLATMALASWQLCCVLWPDPSVFGGGPGSGPIARDSIWRPMAPTMYVGDVVFMTWSPQRDGAGGGYGPHAFWGSSDSTIVAVAPWPEGCQQFVYCAGVTARGVGSASITLRSPWGTFTNVVEVLPAQHKP